MSPGFLGEEHLFSLRPYPCWIMRSELFTPLASSLSCWGFVSILFLTRIRAAPSPPVVVVEEPPEGGVGVAAASPAPYLNTLATIGMIAIAGVVFFLIFRRFPRMASLLAAILFGVVSFSATGFYLLVLSTMLYFLTPSLILLIALTVAILASLGVRKTGAAALLAASVTGSSAGVILGSMVPLVTSMVLVLAIAAFDFFMVRYGYLSALGEGGFRDRLHLMRGLIVEVGDITLGLGDLVFYALLVAATYFHLGLGAAVAANLGVSVGFYLTIRLLRRRSTMPGLPLPLILGLALGWGVALLAGAW